METNRPVASRPQAAKYAPPAPRHVGLLSLNGRIGRASFWKVLVGMIVGVVMLGMLAAVIIPKFASQSASPESAAPAAAGAPMEAGAIVALVVVVAVYAVVFWITLATEVKRFHDMDRSGWMVLLYVIPVVGFIVFLWQGFAEGTEGPNRFGPSAQEIRLT